MKIQTLIKLTDTKDNTDLYDLFCCAAKGQYIETTKKSSNSSDIANLEKTIGNAFDEFAMKMFNEGRKYQKTLDT